MTREFSINETEPRFHALQTKHCIGAKYLVMAIAIKADCPQRSVQVVTIFGVSWC